MATIDFIIGLPPSNHLPQTNDLIKDSMPIAKIYPGIPSFTRGLTLFTRKSTFDTPSGEVKSYKQALQEYGFNLAQPTSDKCLVVAYLADNFPTDSFTNDYGESFLERITNVSSEGLAGLHQILGAQTLGQGVENLAKALEEVGGLAEVAGKTIRTGKETVSKFGTALSKATGGRFNTQVIQRVLAGGRVDFPMIWKSSSFQPSYTMTIRLYNPEPASEVATRKYIVGPLACLMLLGIPMSQDGVVYTWPYIHRIVSPGIYDIDPAFISNITVIKGGDQQQIAYSQRLGMVDVRIDFGSLFGSMLSAPNLSKTRPVLRSYLEGLLPSKKVGFYSSVTKTSQIQTASRLTSQKQTPTVSEVTRATSRVDPQTLAVAKQLESQTIAV
ncbi:MAG: hypothetical protein DRP42_07860 [Tenericutes bacterium]|nr:MAG: hypothetical protein DRP42_07860 [Mycoplasmatota bacterium]